MIDTHCHLNDLKAFPDAAVVVREAQEAGVEKLVVVGIDTEWSQIAVDLADRFDCVYAAVGWHPTSAAKYNQVELKKIEEMASHPKCVAIGEIGFDFYWDYSSLAEQTACLNDHLDLAASLKKPVVFHCREAYPALLDLLEKRPVIPYLFHCFAGDESDANRAVALGAFFGVDGPVTYKKADELRSILKKIGLDRLVLETDSPWLSPVPYRGKPNHPKYLGYVRDGLASVFELRSEEITRATTDNACKFFNL